MLFHQGFNNAMMSVCRPKRYRVLMKLMVEGWREDFNDPALPVGVIGFCAGGDTQNEDNFEAEDYAGAPFIREAQRLGLADVGDPVNTAFLPGEDIQIPGLHPAKKREHGDRAALWALAKIYNAPVRWETASLVSTVPQGDTVVLTFSQKVPPGNRWRPDHTIIHVWSPLVKQPVAVRFAWGTSPMGNLKVNGHPSHPFPGFRTDTWEWPESDDPDESLVRPKEKAIVKEAADRCELRRSEEAKAAVQILERIRTLGRVKK